MRTQYAQIEFLYKISFWGTLLLIILLTPLPYAFANEKKDNVEDLFSASFPNESDGWVSGRRGTVLHTIDGGKTWAAQSTGTVTTLTSIFFIDKENGWSVGDAGTILHTSDGGVTWEKQKSPVPYYLMKVHFNNTRDGWIVTERTHILHTKNGGNTWSVQFSDEDFILKSISFCDEANGWAVGEYGYIYHTADGGKTWEHQAGQFGISEETGEIIGGSILFDVIALDTQTAWVSGIDGYIAKTIDSGKNWIRSGTGVPPVHVFTVFSSRPGYVHVGGAGMLMASEDHGKTYDTERDTPDIRYGWIYDISPMGVAGLVAVGSGGAVYLSDSGTVSWKKAR